MDDDLQATDPGVVHEREDFEFEQRVLDRGYIKIRQAWGSDEDIIAAARQSTSGEFRSWGPLSCETCDGTGQLPMVDPGVAVRCETCKGSGQVPGDERLLAYLWKHKHATPFEMAGFTVEVQAPIFVFREWHRHRTQSYNEMSARYVELPDLQYTPSIERLRTGGQSHSNRQSSGAPMSEEHAQLMQVAINKSYILSREQYKAMLAAGVARELARVVLPVGQYSRMWASARLRNWLDFLTLRTAPDAQWEIRQYAEAISVLVKQLYPRTHELWDGSR